MTKNAASTESNEVKMDRRTNDRRTDAEGITAKGQPNNRKKQRRRQIDPTTCERDYSDPEIEFMHALDAYKRSAGRMFPTCSEILEVIRDLGYVKLTDEQRASLQSDEFEDQPEAFSCDEENEAAEFESVGDCV